MPQSVSVVIRLLLELCVFNFHQGTPSKALLNYLGVDLGRNSNKTHPASTIAEGSSKTGDIKKANIVATAWIPKAT
jgi:hypothetical protein